MRSGVEALNLLNQPFTAQSLMNARIGGGLGDLR
jgi:hypothetical protein